MEVIPKKTTNSRIQFYSQPPTDCIQLDDVERLATDRLKVLRCCESISQEFVKGTKDYNDKMYSQLSKCSELGKSFLNYSPNLSIKSVIGDIKRDSISHALLRLAYCRTDELSRWFIMQEMDLFKFRFSVEKSHNAKCLLTLMSESKIKVEEASQEEVKKLEKIAVLKTSNIYKVKFAKVYDLLASGKVYLEKGWAFVLDEDIFSMVANSFRTNLSHSLSLHRLTLPQLDEETRLMPILSTLHKRYIGKDYSATQNNDKITAQQIEPLSKKSFPPCMQQIQSTLVRDHHLKHTGRMQYGLFLKGIGLPLTESLKFWQTSFQPKVDPEKFMKQYAYSIRHNYGQEGKRVSYTPYSCVKIITSVSAQVGDCHGCPFQRSNLDLLAQSLRTTTTASAAQIDAVVDGAKKHHYQISCGKYFKLVHGLADDYPIAINHPNEYFEESQKILTKKV